MSITEFFDRIGAPLVNSRWSWGGVRPDGTVVLRAWQDQLIRKEGKNYLRLTNHEFFAESQDNLGYRQRNQHVELVSNGARCLLVMCRAVDPKSHPREIASFNDKDLFVGGDVLLHNGDYWVAVSGRRPWRQLV